MGKAKREIQGSLMVESDPLKVAREKGLGVVESRASPQKLAPNYKEATRVLRGLVSQRNDEEK